MINYAYVALIFALLGFVKWYSVTQYESGLNECKAAYAVKLEEAVASAKTTERSRSAVISTAIQEQYDEVSTINNNLLNDLAELRDRPARAEFGNMSGDITPNCETANGAELDRDNAIFLRRYSSIAAKQQTALKSCYSYADSILPN